MKANRNRFEKKNADKKSVSTAKRIRQSLMMAAASVTVFVTTYMMIIPALTIEKDKASEMPGFDLAADEDQMVLVDEQDWFEDGWNDDDYTLDSFDDEAFADDSNASGETWIESADDWMSAGLFEEDEFFDMAENDLAEDGFEMLTENAEELFFADDLSDDAEQVDRQTGIIAEIEATMEQEENTSIVTNTVQPETLVENRMQNEQPEITADVTGEQAAAADRSEVQTEAQTEVQTEAQTEKQTEVQTEVQTEAQTEVQTEKQTEEATEEQTEKQTEELTEAATEKQTEELTEAATEKQTEELTEEATEEQTEAATEKQTEELTETATEEQTEKQTEELTEAATEEATEEQTEATTEEQTEEQTESLTEAYTEEESEMITEEITEEISEEITEELTEEITEEMTEALSEMVEEEEVVYEDGELVYEGADYSVTLQYTADAQIPADAFLQVRELAAGSDEYEMCLAAAKAAMGMNEEDELPAELARFFDITIYAQRKADSSVRDAAKTGSDTVKDNGQDADIADTMEETELVAEENAEDADESELMAAESADEMIKIEPMAAVSVCISCGHKEIADAQADQISVLHFAEGEEDPQLIEISDVVKEETEQAVMTSIAFETESFSVYGVITSGATTDLDGKNFAMVSWLVGRGETGAGLIGEIHPSHKDRLRATSTVRMIDSIDLLVTDDDITMWTFTAAGAGRYVIQADNGSYLNISSKAVTVSSQPQEIQVETRTNFPNQIHLSASGKALNLYNWKVDDGFGPWQDYGANEWFTLYEAEKIDLTQKDSAVKISVQDIQDADQVILYQRVWNETAQAYDLYAVDGNGNLVYLFEKGDTVTWRSGTSIEWKVIMHRDAATNELNGYYDFYNEQTGLFLTPQRDQLVSTDMLGVTMSGRRLGQYSSRVEGWDNGAYGWYGYEVAGQTLQTVSGNASAAFSFARKESTVSGELHEVATVDSAADGIQIRMYNFDSRSQMSGVIGNDAYTNGNINHLVRNTLGDGGYPVAKNGKALDDLFGSHYVGTGNHLFLQSVYDETGYYEYNCFDNFAHYNRADGSFSVYRELGTPSNDNQFYYKRGNFFPFNHLNLNRKATNFNQYKGNGTAISELDPAKGETLYLFEESNDFYFGMTLEANFLQAKDGKDENGNPIIYEFNGDDDLWVFIDNVLVLDIGGIHDAISGSINFSTGTVTAGSETTTIRDMFRAAGVSVNEFDGNTFADYSGHTMKMFYMERGAGASNLEIRFNLPVVEKGTFAVEKQLKGTNQQGYSDVRFAYQAFLIDEDHPNDRSKDIPLRSSVREAQTGETAPQAVNVIFEGTDETVPFHDHVQIGEETYNDIFYLQPGQAAVFHGIPEDVRYYVQEVDVSGDFYETVLINDAGLDQDSDDALRRGDAITATSSAKTITQRQRVLFENQCSPKNIRQLRITKMVENPNPNGDPTFEFRVSLEGRDGKLVPYVMGDYYMMDRTGNYYHYVNGVLTSNGSGEANKVVCSVSGNNGSIAGVPDGFTVIIEGLLADTDFQVEEIRLPDGFEMKEKVLEEGTYSEAQVEGADGRIRLGKDAQVTIVNHHYSFIRVNKIWENGNYPVAKHGDIFMALYRRGADGTETLVENSVKKIAWPGTSAVWNLDLREEEELDSYSIHEVTLSGDGAETGTVKVTALTRTYTPVVVSQERMEGSNTADTTTTYLFTDYTRGGEYVPVSSEGLYIRAREDSITNTIPTLTVNKTDASGQKLAGAVFTLLKEDGETAVEGYESFTSSSEENGNLLREITLPCGTYYLKEISAPAGYIPSEQMVVITVDSRGITASLEDGTPLHDENRAEAGAPQTVNVMISIVNNAGYELPSTGGCGTGVFMILGMVLMALAGMGLVLNAKRRHAAGM